MLRPVLGTREICRSYKMVPTSRSWFSSVGEKIYKSNGWNIRKKSRMPVEHLKQWVRERERLPLAGWTEGPTRCGQGLAMLRWEWQLLCDRGMSVGCRSENVWLEDVYRNVVRHRFGEWVVLFPEDREYQAKECSYSALTNLLCCYVIGDTLTFLG